MPPWKDRLEIGQKAGKRFIRRVVTVIRNVVKLCSVPSTSRLDMSLEWNEGFSLLKHLPAHLSLIQSLVMFHLTASY